MYSKVSQSYIEIYPFFFPHIRDSIYQLGFYFCLPQQTGYDPGYDHKLVKEKQKTISSRGLRNNILPLVGTKALLCRGQRGSHETQIGGAGARGGRDESGCILLNREVKLANHIEHSAP